MPNGNISDSTDFKRDIDHLGHDLNTLRDDAGNVAHDAADAARSGIAELKHGAKDTLDDGKKAVGEAAESLKHIVARHPLASFGIVAGVGMLLGMVICRPRS